MQAVCVLFAALAVLVINIAAGLTEAEQQLDLLSG